MSLPTESDFIVYGDLDEQSACRRLLGKTKAEVRAMLDEDFETIQEDFMFMGPVAFCYYVGEMIAYLKSTEESDELMRFEGLCAYRLECPGRERMHPAAAMIADSLDWFARRQPRPNDAEIKRLHQTRDQYLMLARGTSTELGEDG